jgi:hypothetical protein
MESNMINKLLGAAAMAAVAFAAVPASAAHHSMGGCSGDNLAKTESAIEVMPDGSNKWVAEKEMTAAQTALLDNKWGACAAHLSKAAGAVASK